MMYEGGAFVQVLIPEQKRQDAGAAGDVGECRKNIHEAHEVIT